MGGLRHGQVDADIVQDHWHECESALEKEPHRHTDIHIYTHTPTRAMSGPTAPSYLCGDLKDNVIFSSSSLSLVARAIRNAIRSIRANHSQVISLFL